MVLGMSIPTFTLLHVLISLIGIATGIVVAFGLIVGRKLPGWTGVFLWTTVLTSVTGFMFPFTKFGPPHAFGIISLIVLAPTIAALYRYQLAGNWRWIYVTGSITVLYLNAFVGVVQAFQKISFLNPVAPTQSTEPAFVAAQGALLAAFVALGFIATKRFHPVSLAIPHNSPARI
jgi:hypothetical protein